MSAQAEKDGADFTEHDIRHEDIRQVRSNFIRIDIDSLKKAVARTCPSKGTQTEPEDGSPEIGADPKTLAAWMSDDEKDMISRRVLPK